MTVKGNRLYKFEKLCSKRTIDRLFGADGAKGVSAFPLRAIFSVTVDDNSPSRFLITIPKKRHRHAVDRVLLRRRVREAYRLNRSIIFEPLRDANLHIDVAFIYISPQIMPYSVIEQKMRIILTRMLDKVLQRSEPDDVENGR